MSDKIESGMNREETSSSLLDAFNDDDFDVLWDSSLGMAERSNSTTSESPASKLGGLDIAWGSFEDSGLPLEGIEKRRAQGGLGDALDFGRHDLRHEGSASQENSSASASETREVQMTPELIEQLSALAAASAMKQQQAREERKSSAENVVSSIGEKQDVSLAGKPEVSLLIDTRDFIDSVDEAPSEVKQDEDNSSDVNQIENNSLDVKQDEDNSSGAREHKADAAENVEVETTPDASEMIRIHEEDFHDASFDVESLKSSDDMESSIDETASSEEVQKGENSAKTESAKEHASDEPATLENADSSLSVVDDAVKNDEEDEVLSSDKAIDASSQKGETCSSEANDAHLDEVSQEDVVTGEMAVLESGMEGADGEEASSREGSSDGVNDFEAISSFDEVCEKVCISERARMGRFQPEGEVETAEHTLVHDVIYAKEDCEASVSSSSSASRKKKLFYIAVILLGIILVLLVAISLNSTPSKHLIYAQKSSFQVGTSLFEHYYETPNGAYRTACSPYRGVVLDAKGDLIAEYWPGAMGCVDVRLSDDGRNVWFVDERGVLNKIDLVSEQGFIPREIAVLEGYSGKGFEVTEEKIRWFAQSLDGKNVLRSQTLLGSAHEESDLPDDARICSGLRNGNYAFVSGNAIHMNKDGKVISASLSAPKLGCSTEFTIDCAYDGNENWSVLCENSIHQGQGSQAQTPIHYKNTRIRSGSHHFNLIRHESGTELVTPVDWIHIDSHGNDKTVKLKQSQGDFELYYVDSSEKPLRGISDHRLAEISSDGDVVDVYPLSGMSHVGDAFVMDGKQIVSLFVDRQTKKSKCVTWDAVTGIWIQVQNFDGVLEQFSVSSDGHLGVIMTGDGVDGGAHVLTWVSFQTGEILGSRQLQQEILFGSGAGIEWSDDGRYALLHFVDRTSQLYEFQNGEMGLKREYDGSTVVAFGRNGLIWRLRNGEVVFERIEDGALSVIHEHLSTALQGAQIQAITVHPANGDDVLFWGNSGMWRYRVSTKHINLITDKPVTWVSPDRVGKWVACSAGFVEMATLVLKAGEEFNRFAQPMSWMGASSYAFSNNGAYRVMIDADSLKTLEMHREEGASVIADGSDLHPTGNYMLSARDNMTMISSIEPNLTMSEPSYRVTPIAVMAGSDSKAWCWKMAENGLTQGIGSVCASLSKQSDGRMAPIQAIQEGVAATLHKAMPPVALPPHTSAVYTFIDDVALTVETVPESASLIFVANEGEVPKALTSETGFLPAPFSAKIKRMDTNIGMAVMAPGYELRAVSFTPNSEEKKIRVPLLMTEASDISIRVFEFDENNRPIETEVSEDLRFELASMLQPNREGIKACLAAVGAPKLTLWLDENGVLSAKAPNAAAQNPCFNPIMAEISSKRDKGALPELNSLPDLRFEITLP